jgi:transposase
VTRKGDVLRFLTDPAVPFSRVDDWRGSDRSLGSCRSPAAFARAGASFLTMAPFPVAAHQTGRADFLHPAFT